MKEYGADELKRAVSDNYGALAREMLEETDVIFLGESCCGSGACCSPGAEVDGIEALYSAEQTESLPFEAAQVSLGCGNPVALAELSEGESVLDLGSGAGLDCFLASRAVGRDGRVTGLDMTDAMLELARHNLAKVGANNVEFIKGEMESMPLPDDSFDAIISNCVINLSPDKDAVLRESFRVLKSGGRLRVSDIVLTRPLTTAEQADLASWTGCIAGALSIDDFQTKLTAAGFEAVRITPSSPSAGGYSSADIIAIKPTRETELG